MSATHTLANSFLYEQSDVPPGMSLQEWRRATAKPPSRKSLARRAADRLRPAPRPTPRLRLA